MGNNLKLPWMKWFTGAWLTDPAVTMCQPATRGIWADMLSVMHEQGRQGVITATREQLARLSRCSVPELDQALTDLTLNLAAHVTVRNDIVTVLNRRMYREHKLRDGTRLRVSRYRGNDPCNAHVTPKRLEVRGKSTEDNTPTPPSPPTLDQVKTKAAFVGCPPAEAERFWNHFESSGWVDKNGNAVVKWEAKLATWTADNRAKPLEKAHHNGELKPRDDYWKNSKQLDQVETEIKAIEARGSQTAMDLVIEPRDKERYSRLRGTRKELKKALGLA